jgi:hypothetical protein
MPEQEESPAEVVNDNTQQYSVIIDCANAHELPRKIKAYNPVSAKAVMGFDFEKVWSEKLLK